MVFETNGFESLSRGGLLESAPPETTPESPVGQQDWTEDEVELGHILWLRVELSSFEARAQALLRGSD